MNISSIRLRKMSMDLLRPFTTSFGTMTEKVFILVEVQDDQGRSGWGETVAFVDPSYSEETLNSNWHIITTYLIPLLEQQPITHPSELGERFSRIRGNKMAKAAVEMACWDLLARQRNLPLATLLGGTKTHIDVGISIGIKSSPEELLETIGEQLALGYRRIKIKIMPGWDVAIVERVRKVYPDIALMVDANSAYTLADTEHLRQLDQFGLTMIEQPLAYDDIIDHARLQAVINTPICLDESIHSAEDARKAIELGSCRIINIKAGRLGGLSETIRVHDLCQAHNMPVWCGGMLESGIGRAHNIALSALPNFAMPGDTAASSNYWTEDIIEPGVIVEHGQIAVPQGPGIGYEPVMERVQRHTRHEEVFRIMK